MFICSATNGGIIFRRSWRESRLKFEIICFTSEGLQNKRHCRQISETLLWLLCSSARVRWRAALPIRSANGVCGRRSRQAGTRLERCTCHSPSCECSSELQPWIISSRSKSLSFFFPTLSLQNQPPSPCNYFNTCTGESKRWNKVVSLCLTEESLQNWV